MLSKGQIKLLQTALRAAGIRGKGIPDGRYRTLLRQYCSRDRKPVTSCRQLTNMQMTDLLAICESRGWQMPGRPKNYYREKIRQYYSYSTFAQQKAIQHLAGDLGWGSRQLAGMIRRMTGDRADKVAELSPRQAYNVIEALKSILGRQMGRDYQKLSDVREDYEGGQDGQESKTETDTTG